MENNKLDNVNIPAICGEMITSTGFWYQKALDAWEDWKKFDIDKDFLDDLIKMKYEDFCKPKAPNVKIVRDKLFTAVAYFDERAKDKSNFNKYPDKRTVARTGIRQDDWVQQLLRYKQKEGDLSQGVKNLIDYLENPQNNFPIISNTHKKNISNYFIGKYNESQFVTEMRNYFQDEIKCANPNNFSAAATRVIYHLKEKWNPQPDEVIKGLFVHETDRKWKDGFEEEIGDGKGCFWWHQLPVQYRDEIMTQLSNIIEDGGTFDFYFVDHWQAKYKARVVDFATADNYDNKYPKWEKENPISLEKDLPSYNDDKHTAEIVFLVDDFHKLENPFHVNNFVRYKNMAYSHRGGIPAFTKIITADVKTMENDYIKEIRECVELLSNEKNLILQGAPGTGKTYNTAAIAVGLIDGTDADIPNHAQVMKRYQDLVEKGQIAFTTFHQSMDYEDFIEGLRPEVKDGQVTYDVKPGIFRKICAAAGDDPDNDFVLIVDEINRGNVSKIFGELISLIEKDKRDSDESSHRLTASLTYSGDNFGVPANLHILGTMNTTDRSTGILDYALRRRFVFKTMKADEQVVKAQDAEIAQKAVPLFRKVNEFIKSHNSGDMDVEDLMVGHSYFLAKTEQQLKENLEYKIMPLIKEYINDGMLRVPQKSLRDTFKEWAELKTDDNAGSQANN